MTENLAPVYLVVGDDPYLVASALDEIMAGASRLATTEFGPGADPPEILRALDTASIFGDRRAVVVKGLDEMGADAQRQIASYLEDPNESVTLILQSSRALPKIAAAVRKAGRVVEATRGRRTELFGWLREETKSRGLKASGDAMGALVDAIGEERLALTQALDELSLALAEGERLTPDLVVRHFSGRAHTKVFGFVDAVAGRQPGAALESLHRLLRQGEHTQALFWTLTRHFRFLLLVGDSSASDLTDRLGVQSWRAEKLIRQARNFARPELVDAYRALAEADRKIKKSEEPEELTIERAVVKIATR